MHHFNEEAKHRWQRILSDPESTVRVRENILQTYLGFSMSQQQAEQVWNKMVENYQLPSLPIEAADKQLHQMVAATEVTSDGKRQTVKELMGEMAAKRRDIIATQLFDKAGNYLQGETIDVGGGGGRIALDLQKRLQGQGTDSHFTLMELADFRRGEGKNVDLVTFDHADEVKPKSFANSVASCCHHHFTDPDKVISTIARITRDHLVMIEPIPNDASVTAEDVVWAVDYVTNRILGGNNHIPMPGGYRTQEAWVDRLKQEGWELEKSSDLGKGDQLTLGDVSHTLMVFKKRQDDQVTER